MNKFAAAKAKPITAASAPGQVEEYIATPGLEILAQIDALEKQLDALKKTTLRPEIQEAMITQFMRNKGENYKGKENSATASLELRKRASNSGLKEQEIELCLKHNIPTIEIEGDFKLNVEGLTERKLEEISKALDKIKGLPADFIQFDAKKARTIVADDAIDTMFRLNDQDTIKTLMPVVGVFAIKPKTTSKMKDIMKAVSALVEE
jgi:hypothetical protein